LIDHSPYRQIASVHITDVGCIYREIDAAAASVAAAGGVGDANDDLVDGVVFNDDRSDGQHTASQYVFPASTSASAAAVYTVQIYACITTQKIRATWRK